MTTDARTEPELTNPRAERVKAVRALSGRSARQRHGLYLAEGPQAVREAVRADHVAVRDLYLTPAAAGRHAEIVGEARARRLRVQLGSPEVLDAMSPDAQGVLAVLESRPRTLAESMGTGPSGIAGGLRLVAVLAHVRDPGNAGAAIRAADAAGADLVVLTDESVDVQNPKVVRSTAGSLFHLPVVAGPTLAEVVTSLRAAGVQVLAADGSGDRDLDDLQDAAHGGVAAEGDRCAPPPDEVDLRRRTAWVFGNEAWGLSEEDRALADAVVRVPIHGRAESLNLATAATVCLYASARAQRRSATAD